MSIAIQAIVWPALIIVGLAIVGGIVYLVKSLTRLEGSVQLLRAETPGVVRAIVREETKIHVELYHVKHD